MADCLLTIFWNVVGWTWPIIVVYELAMLDLDGHQNENKHIAKATLLLLITILIYFLAKACGL